MYNNGRLCKAAFATVLKTDGCESIGDRHFSLPPKRVKKIMKIPKIMKKEKADELFEIISNDFGTIADFPDDYQIGLSKVKNEVIVKIHDFYGNVFIYRKKIQQ